MLNNLVGAVISTGSGLEICSAHEVVFIRGSVCSIEPARNGQGQVFDLAEPCRMASAHHTFPQETW
jgi:hypothetical protein